MAGPNGSFMRHLNALFNNDRYYDVTVMCDGHTFKAHQAILCSHARYFQKMFGGSFSVLEARMITDPAQEAESKTVELKDDGLDAVTGMMQYFYGIDFETSKDNSFTTGERTHLAIKLYAISDKYGIPNLGTFAQAKFSKHLAQLFESDPSEDLIKVIDAVYATTPVEPCTRNALRYTIIQQMHHLLVFLAGAPVEVFKDLDIDGLPRDLVQYVTSRYPKRLQKYKCPAPHCGYSNWLDWDDTHLFSQGVTCARCCRTHNLKQWAQGRL
ncbi:hypothetical protein LTR66_009841 [Elasticomyces elasticus]|nr:hypothetical protein LTR66_009841 [Elasticomyces elasticus]